MHNSWGRALIAFYLSAPPISFRRRNSVDNFSKRFVLLAYCSRGEFSFPLLFRFLRSKKRVHSRFQRGEEEEEEERSDEANTAGAILLCCRSGDPFLSSNSRRLFFLSSLPGRPANFQYCPKQVVYLGFISISHGSPLHRVYIYISLIPLLYVQDWAWKKRRLKIIRFEANYNYRKLGGR